MLFGAYFTSDQWLGLAAAGILLAAFLWVTVIRPIRHLAAEPEAAAKK